MVLDGCPARTTTVTLDVVPVSDLVLTSAGTAAHVLTAKHADSEPLNLSVVYSPDELGPKNEHEVQTDFSLSKQRARTPTEAEDWRRKQINFYKKKK